MVQTWHRHGKGLVRTWYRHGTEIQSFLQTWKNSFLYDEWLFTNTILVDKTKIQELSFQFIEQLPLIRPLQIKEVPETCLVCGHVTPQERSDAHSHSRKI